MLNFAVFDELTCWIMLISACVIGLVSTAALISERYRECFFETVGLTLVSFSAIILVMQIMTRNWAIERGVMFFMGSVAFYAAATGIKYTLLIRRYYRG